MSDRTCASCGRKITDDERPWTVTGVRTEESKKSFGVSVLVCEECYDERGQST